MRREAHEPQNARRARPELRAVAPDFGVRPYGAGGQGRAASLKVLLTDFCAEWMGGRAKRFTSISVHPLKPTRPAPWIWPNRPAER